MKRLSYIQDARCLKVKVPRWYLDVPATTPNQILSSTSVALPIDRTWPELLTASLNRRQEKRVSSFSGAGAVSLSGLQDFPCIRNVK